VLACAVGCHALAAIGPALVMFGLGWSSRVTF